MSHALRDLGRAPPVKRERRPIPLAQLSRETFTTSRLAEFCSQRELVAQTGHAVADWPLTILKELVDNGIDSAEEIGTAPSVNISVDCVGGDIVVADNGSGLPPETVMIGRRRLVIYSSIERLLSVHPDALDGRAP